MLESWNGQQAFANYNPHFKIHKFAVDAIWTNDILTFLQTSAEQIRTGV
jgi:hypothetical protein